MLARTACALMCLTIPFVTWAQSPHDHGDSSASAAAPPTRWDTPDEALPWAQPSPRIPLTGGETQTLDLTVVRQKLAGHTLTRWSYGGSLPGPTWSLPQGASFTLTLRNQLPQETTLHSHGLRQSALQDGVAGVGQAPIAPGQSHTYTLSFPDPGLYWYHPHIREDAQQDMGLSGLFWVEPSAPSPWAPVDRTEGVLLDDIKLEGLVPYPATGANHALMGRYGDTLLFHGEVKPLKTYRPGEVVRLAFGNASNARPFRLQWKGAKAKVVGADLGPVAQEFWMEAASLSPGERLVLDVAFPRQGAVTLVNLTPEGETVLAEWRPDGSPQANGAPQKSFGTLRSHSSLKKEWAKAQQMAKTLPMKTLQLGLSMDMSKMHMSHQQPAALPAKIPLKKDVPWAPSAQSVEWEDGMKAANALSSTDFVKWTLTDETGKTNMAVAWQLKQGSHTWIRLDNRSGGMHPMQHPIHFHGQRFWVLVRNGKPLANGGWKDTVTVGTGDWVDILLEARTPGPWMGHCHIAEHLTGGMMMGFSVGEENTPSPQKKEPR